MDRPASLHKLTVLAQLLDRLRTHTLEAQNTVIKAAGWGRSALHAAEPLPLAFEYHARNHGRDYPGARGPSARYKEDY